LRVEIEAIAAAPVVAPVSAQVVAPIGPLWQRALPVVAAAIIVGALSSLATWYFKPSSTAPVVTRFAFPLGEIQQSANPARQLIAISPDGTMIAYAANARLYLRPAFDLEARPIPGTENSQNQLVSSPTFSPNGRSIAFWSGADRTIKRTAVSGGAAVTICAATNPFGMSWDTSGIVFTQAEGIMRASADGGQAERLVDAAGEGVVNSPQILPDADTLLFTLAPNTGSRDRWDQARIVAQSLRTGERKTLIEGGSNARYVPTGHLLYTRGGVLYAEPFDLKRLKVTGGAVPVVEGVWRAPSANGGAALFAVSDTGSLVYIPGPTGGSDQSALALIDRKGVVTRLKAPAGDYESPRVSPDGSRLAFGTSDGKQAVIATYELSEATAVRQLTFEGNNRFPIWLGNDRVAFQSDRRGNPAIFWQSADAGIAEQLTTPDQGTSHIPESWSPRDDVLLFSATKGGLSSLWTLSLKDRKAILFGDVKGSTIPTNAIFSPDGRSVAYQVGRAGVTEGATYVQPFPPTGAKNVIVQEGGRPLWSRDGKELFFVPSPGRFMVVSVNAKPIFTVTTPIELPRSFGAAGPNSPRSYDIMPDGRIVGVVGADQSPSGSTAANQFLEMHVVLNWFEELKSKVPTK
jgi:eukaryotic-like serine/threonine-protein kinase